jgi:hypothetical protein
VRSEVVYALVQRLADLGADAEGGPRRTVPVPEHALVLPDQLTVMAADLLLTGDAGALAVAADEVAETAHRV